jgi:hypothetical protein
MLVILHKCVADVSTRQEIFDWIPASSVGVYYNPMLGIKIDKTQGVILCNGTTYPFTPVFRPV